MSPDQKRFAQALTDLENIFREKECFVKLKIIFGNELLEIMNFTQFGRQIAMPIHFVTYFLLLPYRLGVGQRLLFSS